MDNPIVAAVAGACAGAGVATLRFNFRGVGGSGGTWDEGRGEQDDVRAAAAHLRARLARPGRIALAGYSFGAAMSAAVAAGGESLAGLALIAPPLAMRPWAPPASLAIDGPILVAAGSRDEYCPREALQELGRALKATVTVIDGADHFFFTGLERLEGAVAAWAAAIS
jgi:alpha/beta superfamily hydrolase